jgi:hypothetical protein
VTINGQIKGNGPSSNSVGQPTTALSAILLAAEVLAALLARAGSFLTDIPSSVKSPQNMDRSVDPRQGFYRYSSRFRQYLWLISADECLALLK